MLAPYITKGTVFDNFVNDCTRQIRKITPPQQTFAMMMKTDVKESETGFELTVDLPGYKKEDIQLQLKDGYLTISASRRQEADETNEPEENNNGFKYIRRERFYGNCKRSFYIGEVLEQEDIKARFENGVLTVSVPKKTPEPKEESFIYIEG